MKKAVFLYDYTGLMAQPWLDAGYLCYSFDGQHPSGKSMPRKNHVVVGGWCDPLKKLIDANQIVNVVGDGVEFVFGFPECTDLTVAGAKHFERKRNLNSLFQLEAIELADLVRCVGVLFDCPWAFENPVGVLSTQYRKYDFKFDPCDYGGYLPGDDIHPLYPDIYPPRDAYKKATCIWHGNGFKKPKMKRVDPVSENNPGWEKLGGNSLRTKNIRSATPRGFAQAVFESNKTC
jgi:hypothetical protein